MVLVQVAGLLAAGGNALNSNVCNLTAGFGAALTVILKSYNSINFLMFN